MERRRHVWGLKASLTVFVTLTALTAVSALAQSDSPYSRYQERKRLMNENTVTIMAAGITGTYAPIVQDMQSVLDETDKPGGLRVLPVLGRGGGANVLDILFLKGVDMGITQQEHLAFFKQRDPVLHAQIYDRIHYVTKLYNSEYHLLARKDIKSFEDLKGKKVNFYKNFSATDIAGQTIFKILGIKVEATHYDLKTSIQKLKDGEIAAATYLAGAPVSGYVSLVSPEDNLHFVPLSPETLSPGKYEKLLEVFLPATLKNEIYPNIIPAGEEVPTVASGAVLAVYNWKEDSDRYRKVAYFVRKFFDNFDKFLEKPRHPKWKEVNLAAEIPGWTRFKAAQEWLDEHRQTASPKLRSAFEEFLKSSASGEVNLSKEQKDALFSQFVKWQRAKEKAKR